MQASQLLVQVAQPRGHAGDVAVALVGGLRGADRLRQRLGEDDRPAFDLAALGQGEEALLGLLDLVGGLRLARLLVGVVDHLLAELDELAAQKEVVDDLAVIGGVDDADHRGGQSDEVLRAADLAEGGVLVELTFEGHRVGDLAALDQRADGREDAAVERIEEVLGPQELVDAVEDLVVDQDRAQKRLLGLVVVRGLPVGELVADRRDFALRRRVHRDPPGSALKA